MFIQLTRTDGAPVWLNSVFVVTVEPTRSGGSIVVPIGDGLDYEVRESPKVVLEMLEGAPQVKVVPVPPPKALTPKPDDVSPDVSHSDEAPVADEKSEQEPRKRTRKTKSAPKKKTAEGDSAKTEVDAPAKKRRASVSKKSVEKSPLPEDFLKIVDDLKARKCRTVKRMRNAIKSYYGKTDSVEVDRIIEEMMNGGYIVVEADGHVNWTGQVE